MDIVGYSNILAGRCLKARKLKRWQLSKELHDINIEISRMLYSLQPELFSNEKNFNEAHKRLEIVLGILSEALEGFSATVIKKFDKSILTTAADILYSLKGLLHVDSNIVPALKEYVKYRIDPSTLQTGDVLAQISSPKKLSHIIQNELFNFLRDSDVQHVMLILRADKVMFADFTAKGMRYKEFSPRPGTLYIAQRHNLSPAQKDMMIQEFLNIQKKNPKYSNSERFGAYWSVFMKKVFSPLKPIKNIYNDTTSYFCSEFIHEIYKKVGILLVNKPSNTVLTTDVLSSSQLQFCGLVYDNSVETKELLENISKEPNL